MLIECRPHTAAPLSDLSAADSLRLRRRYGRAAYLLALLSGRRNKQLAAPQPVDQPQARCVNAGTLPS
jgi:hypothetical protein